MNYQTSIQKQIEFITTNCVGYETETKINSSKNFVGKNLSFLVKEEKVKNSKYFLQAHLADLKYRRMLVLSNRVNGLLKNSKKNHLFNLLYGEKTLTEKQRIKKTKNNIKVLRNLKNFRDSNIESAINDTIIKNFKNGKFLDSFVLPNIVSKYTNNL